MASDGSPARHPARLVTAPLTPAEGASPLREAVGGWAGGANGWWGPLVGVVGLDCWQALVETRASVR